MNATEHIKTAISYLGKCYAADSNANQLTSIFSSSIESLIMLENSEVLNGELDHYQIEEKQAKEINSTLQLYIKEKELKGYFLTVKSLKNVLGKVKTIYTPVYIFDGKTAELDGFPFIEIDRSTIEVNPAVIQILNSNDQIENQVVIDTLNNFVLNGKFDFGNLHQLKSYCEENFNHITFSKIDKYPELCSAASTKRYKIPNDKDGVLVNNAGFFVRTKSKKSQGVLNEIDRLIQIDDYNPALTQYITGNYKSSEKAKDSKSIFVPAILSGAQEKILKNVDRYQEQMIVGPPGTGKSYTIAAIAVNEASKGNSVLVVSGNPQAVSVVDKRFQKILESRI